MPKPTRPTASASAPQTVPVSFDCPADLAARLAELAKNKGVPLRAFVASLVLTPIQDQLAELPPQRPRDLVAFLGRGKFREWSFQACPSVAALIEEMRLNEAELNGPNGFAELLEELDADKANLTAEPPDLNSPDTRPVTVGVPVAFFFGIDKDKPEDSAKVARRISTLLFASAQACT